MGVEDLWKLPLPRNKRGVACLDDIAKTLYKALKEDDQESFVAEVSRADEGLQLGFDIVKHIISVRLEEQKAAENVRVARQKKQQILAIIAEKESEELKGTSLKDLRALLADL